MKKTLLEQIIFKKETVWRKANQISLKSQATVIVTFAMLLFFSINNTANAQVAFTENFNSGLNGWSTNWSSTSGLACEGTSAARKNIYTAGTAGSFTSPSVGTSNGGLITLSFLYKITNWPAATVATPATFGTINVQYSGNSTGPWTTVHTINSTNHTPNASCDTVTVPSFSVGPGSMYVRFECLYGTGDYYMYFDDINISQSSPPSCVLPAALAATNITANTADLSWTSGSGLSIGEYGIAGFTPGTGSTLGTTSPQSISGLSPITNYEFYVIDDCGTNGISDTAWSSFTTSIQGAVGVTCTTPGANSTVLFTEEFDNNTAGWTGDIGSSGGQWEIPDGSGSSSTGASSAHSGANFMNVEASGFATGNTASIVTPAIDMSAAVNDAELSFWMHAYGANMGDLDVGVGTSATGPFTTVFSWSGQLQTSGTAPWQNVGVNLASYVGQTIYVEYKMTSTTGGFTSDMSIDLMEVTSCLSCVAPSAIAASNITSTGADVSWTAGLNETAWDAQWGPTGFALGTGDSIATTLNPVSLVGLTPNTIYDFYVRADCGGTSGVSG